jgi:DNA gyrase/topoisomerase IV subunit B
MLATSPEYRQLSFVNGVHTKQGGNHVTGVIDEISDELIAMVKRKHKVEITKARIKEGLLIALFVRDLSSPKYDGQTKERLSSPWGQIRDHMGIDFKALARRILNTEGVILPIIENALARKEAADKAAATKAEKKAKKSNVAKHVKANGLGRQKCTLFLTEGDSAIGFFVKSRDEDTQGGFPLRGKILNVWEETDARILTNKEILDLLSIFNVGLRSKEKPAYDYIAIMVDADQDGKGSIYPLILAFIYKYWPHWYKEGRIHFVKTPEYISTNGKDVVWCYSDTEYRSKKFTGKNWNHRHIKGLGSLTEEEYAKCIQKPYLERVVLGDNAEELFEMLFSSDPNKRKEWLGFTGKDVTDDVDES